MSTTSAAMRPIEPSGSTRGSPANSSEPGSRRVSVVPPWPSSRRSLVTMLPSRNASIPLWERSAGSRRSASTDRSSGSSLCIYEPLTLYTAPLAWTRIDPHHTWLPHGSRGEVATGSKVSGSAPLTLRSRRSTHP